MKSKYGSRTLIVLPDSSNIKIIKFPGGSHYYAKIGDEDVAIDGKQKWSSAQMAEQKALEYKKLYKLN